MWLQQVTKTKGAHTDVNGKILTKGLVLKNKDEISIGGRVFRFEGFFALFACACSSLVP